MSKKFVIGIILAAIGWIFNSIATLLQHFVDNLWWALGAQAISLILLLVGTAYMIISFRSKKRDEG